MRSVLTCSRIVAAAAILVGAACAGRGDESSSASTRPSVVVTTNILGDVVSRVVGDAADVEVIMPVGTDPHDFAPSARQAESMEDADLLVTNGAGFEAAMADVISQAADGGATSFDFTGHVPLLERPDAGGADPHIWTDPARMATAVGALTDELVALDGVDVEAVRARGVAYAAELRALDAEIAQLLSSIPSERRALVTNHDVFGYFADRYGFEQLGAVIPALTTNAQASAAQLAELAAVIEDAGVPAIFAETTQPSELAGALADEVGGDVQVVELFSESLGPTGSGAETYADMMRTNARRIADALG